MSAEMDALVASATQKLEALEAALYGLKQVRGRFTSPDGAVSVEVNSDGALVGLTLAESVTSLPPAEVGQLIVWACRQAAEDAGAQRSKVVATLNESFVPAAAPPAGTNGGGPDSA
ncbi:YbaB/EbfC family nucleoid-associated protein [Nocardia implantans]|uniref:YbaB/EbfC family nucleoid-associated protein n=1 Tax=Nocardia implantans TaxID=3108168 RepID=A0ABU6AVQ7_9NOCA|nr:MULTISPECIES: YbaB/EbfC family nucleoid-associated protein [unclassified Nocardia]MBF6193063.1 YbaB/EbfC family nucleoid-associated protein [Nocardia beijingensis]MEA3532358.1 YbaB/EbfC family nucleoid-associated protein [Nocardia sp. CDC192]MEB3511565.1 YbaB/EbfC family nucleoid-associated protein [Nocardia sp. CDC186]